MHRNSGDTVLNSNKRVIFLAGEKNENEFIESLDDISVPTRYPEELGKLLKEYTQERAQIIFNNSKGVLKWLKKELKKQ